MYIYRNAFHSVSKSNFLVSLLISQPSTKPTSNFLWQTMFSCNETLFSLHIHDGTLDTLNLSRIFSHHTLKCTIYRYFYIFQCDPINLLLTTRSISLKTILSMSMIEVWKPFIDKLRSFQHMAKGSQPFRTCVFILLSWLMCFRSFNVNHENMFRELQNTHKYK